MLFNIYNLWVVKDLYNNSFVIVISNWITNQPSIIYTKEQTVSNAYIIIYGETIVLIFISIIYESTDLFPWVQYVVCNHYSLVPLQLLNYLSFMKNILIYNKLTHHHSIILYTKEYLFTHDM